MEIIREIRERPQAWALRSLAAAAVVLALICVCLAAAWKAEHDRAECWRAAFEDDEIPAAGAC